MSEKTYQHYNIQAETPHGTTPCRICGHPLPLPAFDEEAARGLSADEVRHRWPRGHERCACGTATIIYASVAHYLAGDW